MNDTPTPKTDAILSRIPGGQTCDPQLVADELRGPIAELERELASERALADRLCACLERHAWRDGHETPNESEEAISAWKASRDPSNLEGPGPSEDERRENARAIQAMTEPERHALMFGKTETKDD